MAKNGVLHEVTLLKLAHKYIATLYILNQKCMYDIEKSKHRDV